MKANGHAPGATFWHSLARMQVGSIRNEKGNTACRVAFS
jgi:hypothetical protein